MAYQPLYATVQDTNGERGTHSCRSRVNWINGWLNSELGSVMKWSANLRDEEYPGAFNRVRECKQKITHFEELKQKNKVEDWKKKFVVAEANYEENQKRKVHLEITIPEEIKDKVTINFMGIRFEPRHIALLQKTHMKDFMGKLSIASAFALIPDIDKVVSAKTDKEKKEAVKSFVDKRDNLDKFFKKEDEKLRAEIDGIGD